MVFSNYRQLVRTADAEKSFGITPGCLAVVGRRQEAVEAAKAVRQSGAGAKIVRLQVAAAT